MLSAYSTVPADRAEFQLSIIRYKKNTYFGAAAYSYLLFLKNRFYKGVYQAFIDVEI